MLEALTVAKRKQDRMAKRMIGRFVIADPEICHGQPTFRGTRILVADVLEQVAAGMAWETIVEEWRGNVSSDAISEAVRLASQAFHDHSAEYTAPEYVLELLDASRIAARQIGVDLGQGSEGRGDYRSPPSAA